MHHERLEEEHRRLQAARCEQRLRISPDVHYMKLRVCSDDSSWATAGSKPRRCRRCTRPRCMSWVSAWTARQRGPGLREHGRLLGALWPHRCWTAGSQVWDLRISNRAPSAGHTLNTTLTERVR